LQESVLAFCSRALRPGGALLCKAFAGESMQVMRARLSARFDSLRELKPAASRAQSREVYHLALGFIGDGDIDGDGDVGDGDVDGDGDVGDGDVDGDGDAVDGDGTVGNPTVADALYSAAG